MIAEAESAGVLEPGEKEMIAGVMRLGDRPVRAVMTPRWDVDMLDLASPREEIRAAIAKSSHSRLPVYDRNPDDVLGSCKPSSCSMPAWPARISTSGHSSATRR